MRNFALSQTTGIKKYKSLKALKNLSLEDIRQYYDQLLKTDVVFFKVISDLDSTEVCDVTSSNYRKNERQVDLCIPWDPQQWILRLALRLFVSDSNLKNVGVLLADSLWNDRRRRLSSINDIQGNLGDLALGGCSINIFREELGLLYGTGSSYRTEEYVRFSRNLRRSPVAE